MDGLASSLPAALELEAGPPDLAVASRVGVLVIVATLGDVNVVVPGLVVVVIGAVLGVVALGIVVAIDVVTGLDPDATGLEAGAECSSLTARGLPLNLG